MKIKHLTLYNLNSLQGKWEIPFDKEPFNSTGLFAITGPTGAGKSTIFDAICLALYGRTPRLKNPEEIMSRHTGECFAELTFTVNRKVYRSRWEQRRSRGKADGKLQGSKMFVQSLDGNMEKLLEEKKSAVPVLIASITGLDYDQFTRSILLAQGNFASFLKAGINDRADLLEKMTGTDIYTKISIEAFNRSKEEDDKLIRLKEKSGDTEILSESERSELFREKTQLEENRDKAILARQKYVQAKSWLDQEVILKLRVDNSKFDYDKAKTEADNLPFLEQEYKKANTILQNSSVYNQKQTLSKELSDINHVILEQLSEEKALQKNLDHMESVLHQSLEDQKRQLELANDLVEKKEKLAILENSILSLGSQIDNSQKVIQEKKQQQDVEEQKRSLISEELFQKNKKKTHLLSYLEDNSFYSNILKSLPLLTDLFTRLEGNKILDLDEIKNLSKKNDTEMEKLRELESKILLIDNENPGKIEDYKRFRELLQNLGPISKRYRDILSQKELYDVNKKSYLTEISRVEKDQEKTLSLFRRMEEAKTKADLGVLVNQVQSHLHDGDTCPVCQGIYKEELKSKVEEAFNISEMKITENQLLKLNSREETLKQLIDDAQKNSDLAESEKKLILQEWNNLKISSLGNLEPWEKDRANKIYLENEQKIQDCQNWENELRLLEEERVEKEKEIQLNLEYQKNVLRIKEVLGSDITGKINIKELTKECEGYDRNREHYENIETSIRELENNIDVISHKIESLAEMIHSEREEFTKNKKKIENLRVELHQISDGKNSEEIKNLIESIRFSATERVEKNRHKVYEAKESLTVLSSSLEQNKKRKPLIENDLSLVIQDFNELLIEKKLSEDDFHQEDLFETVEKLQKEVSFKKENIIRTEEAYKHAKQSMNEHLKVKPDESYLSEAIIAIEKNDLMIENSSRDMGIIDEKIRRDDIAREKIREIVKDIENQEKECYKWSRLKSLIGSADGKLYRRFVQGLTLEKLVRLANSHLVKINNRYRIERSTEKELELEIVDGWQADTIRPSSTLSGGESFLVSLALSLGLSDLVGNKVVIDSLFLDEGFGTLDPDSLETVLAALETLQASGKMIGIISHVAAIRERIAVQIRVNKQAGGKSSIEIV